jgi:hypothetical protein
VQAGAFHGTNTSTVVSIILVLGPSFPNWGLSKNKTERLISKLLKERREIDPKEHNNKRPKDNRGDYRADAFFT